MRSLISMFSVLSLVFALGCGSDDNKEEPIEVGADAAPAADAKPATPQPDAGPNLGEISGKAIGRVCTPSQNPQGDCPEGYWCVPGGTQENPGYAICTKRCETLGDHTSCGFDYDGPGKPLCILTLQGGTVSGSVCAVVCESSNPQTGCTPQTCDGTCPGEEGTTSCESIGTDVKGCVGAVPEPDPQPDPDPAP